LSFWWNSDKKLFFSLLSEFLSYFRMFYQLPFWKSQIKIYFLTILSDFFFPQKGALPYIVVFHFLKSDNFNENALLI